MVVLAAAVLEMLVGKNKYSLASEDCETQSVFSFSDGAVELST